MAPVAAHVLDVRFRRTKFSNPITSDKSAIRRRYIRDVGKLFLSSTMGRRKKGQLQAAPDYDSGRSKLARLYQQQKQQRHEEQPKQHQERQEQQQQQPGWGKHCLIVAGIIIILTIILLAFFVIKSLSIAEVRAEECNQRYDNVTKVSTLLYETMKYQLEESRDEVDSLKTSQQELQQRLDEEIQGRRDDRQLALKKDNELQILVEEKRQLQRTNEDLNGRIHKCNGEKKTLERVISERDREKQQMKSKKSDITGTIGFLGVMLVIGGGGVVLCGILGGKK